MFANLKFTSPIWTAVAVAVASVTCAASLVLVHAINQGQSRLEQNHEWAARLNAVRREAQDLNNAIGDGRWAAVKAPVWNAPAQRLPAEIAGRVRGLAQAIERVARLHNELQTSVKDSPDRTKAIGTALTGETEQLLHLTSAMIRLVDGGQVEVAKGLGRKAGLLRLLVVLTALTSAFSMVLFRLYRIDVRERRHAEAALGESDERYRQLVELLPDGIAIHSAEGLVYLNVAGARLLGAVKAEDVLGRSMISFVHPECRDAVREAWDRAVHRNGAQPPVQLRLHRTDGSSILVEVLLIRTTYGERPALQVVLREIHGESSTESPRTPELNRDLQLLSHRIKELEDGNTHLEAYTEQLVDQSAELTLARDAALDSSRMKSEFLANVSQQIRTPMSGVIGMIGLLMDSRLNQDQREYAEAIRQSVEYLLELINGVLEFSRIETGKVEIQSVPFDIRATFQDVVETLARRADDKGLELACFVPSAVPETVIGDPASIRQVLTDLVSNAVKFTEVGEVLVCAELEEESADTAVVRLEVSDTGIGIPPEMHGRLFQPFSPGDHASTRYTGTGLGLAIARHLVELMGGDIGFDSTPGKGSTFWFTLRFKKAVDAHEHVSGSNGKDLAGARVLVVDDNRGHRRILRRRLKELSVLADEAATPEEALGKIRAAVHPFDAALIDLKMPDLSGIDLAKAICSLPGPPPTKLVLMTPFSQRSCKQAATEAGFSAILDKPLRDWYLRETLGQLVKLESQETAQPVLPPVQVENPTRDHKGYVLIAEDNPVNQKVAARLVEQLGYAADVVGNGEECVHALERFPYNIVLMDCHMPVMDGFEASRAIRLRGTGHVATVPIIAMAASGECGRTIEAGMNDYITKPVKSEQLAAVLRRWCLEPANAGERV